MRKLFGFASSLFMLVFLRCRPAVVVPVLLRNEEEGQSSQEEGAKGISDDTYHRIPDHYKTPSNDSKNGSRDDSSKGAGGKGKSSSEDASSGQGQDEWGSVAPRRPIAPRTGPTLSHLILLLVFGIIFYSLYVSTSSSKTTEISWNGFNSLVDPEAYATILQKQLSEKEVPFEQLVARCATPGQRRVESVNMHGNKLTGRLRYPIQIEELPRVLPRGDMFFENLLRQVDPRLSPEDMVSILRQPLETTWEMRPLPIPKNASRSEGYEIIYKQTAKRTNVVVSNRFSCEVPVLAYADPAMDKKIRSDVDSYTSTTPTDNTGIFMIVSIGVSILLIWLIFRAMRRTNEQMMGGGGFGAFNRSPARRYDPNSRPVTFKDVAGLENVKNELVEIVDFLKNPGKYEQMGATVPKGTLLFGPPGTGKTLLGRAVAGEAGVPFFSINGSEFIQMFVGVGASRVRDLFNSAKESAPSILFIDEIDAVGRQRGTGVGGGQDEREQTLNQILSEMDGFTPNESVMVMAATNRPDVLDPALMRPGRFDRHITVDRPSLKGRIEIFEVYIAKVPAAEDVNIEKLARSTVGFTGADIRNLVNEAALWATRNNKSCIEMADFEFAHEKVIMGLKREETISEDEKRKTAYHEAGHTIIGWFSAIKSHVHKVTIIPRGRSLGATYFLPDEDQVNINESQVRAMLARYLGGRAAELIVFEESSAGAEEDLKQATQLARKMTTHWGMSKKLGPIAFRGMESHPFLGREMSSDVREFSESTAQLIDEEVFRFLREADEIAHNMLKEKRELLEKLCDALVDEEELDQDRLTEILGPSLNQFQK